jgi:orotate phosphoribosyltransferase
VSLVKKEAEMSAPYLDTSLAVAKCLIDSGCVKLSPKQPFTYASGLKGPIYCDNRLLLSDPKHRREVMLHFKELLLGLTQSQNPDALVGVATAGIPHAAFLSWLCEWPMLYVRAQKKSHGLGNQIEGWRPGIQTVICIEDLVNQGGSLAEAVAAVQEHGLHVQACLSIVDYEMATSRVKLQQVGVKLYSLTTFGALVEYGHQSGVLTSDDVEALKRWQKSPETWS